MAYNAISKRMKRKTLDLTDSNVLKQFLSENSPEVPSTMLESYAEPISDEIRQQPIFRTPAGPTSSSDFIDLDQSTREARQDSSDAGPSRHKRARNGGRRLCRSEGEDGLLESNGVNLLQKLLKSLTELKGQTLALTEKQEEGFKLVNERIDSIKEGVAKATNPCIRSETRPLPVAGKRRQNSDENALSRCAHQLYGQSEDIQFDLHSGSINSRLNVDAVEELIEALEAKWGDRYDKKQYKAAVSKVYRRKRQEAKEQDDGKESELKRKRMLNNRRWRKLCDRKSVCETEEEKEFWDPVRPELMSDDEKDDNDAWITLKHPFRSAVLNVKCRIMDGRLIAKGRQAKRKYVDRVSQRERKQQYAVDYVVPN